METFNIFLSFWNDLILVGESGLKPRPFQSFVQIQYHDIIFY